MGLFNAPATFQILMNTVSRVVDDKFVVVYLDYVLILSNTKEDHKKHIKLKLERINRTKLYVSPTKCQLFQKEVEFLGLLAWWNGVRVDPSTVEIIEQRKKPRNLTELRGFLEIVQFFKRFTQNYSAIAKPLTDWTKKGYGISTWNAECDDAFSILKKN